MKKVILAVVGMVVLGGLAFSQSTEDFQKLETAKQQAQGILDTFLGVLPNAATQQNIQPKAWIGYLVQVPYPEITKKSGKVTKELPHFTLGPSLGVGIMKIDGLKEIVTTLGGDEDDLPLPLLPLPSFSVDARIGGVKVPGLDLPFDLGFSFFTLDIGALLGDDLDLGLKWTNWGVDARYLVLRQNRFIPDVSANVGFAHWALNLETTNIGAELSTDTVYFGAQASYTLNFFIPYLGFKMMTGKSKGEVTVTVDDIRLTALNIENSRTVLAEKKPFQVQIFGGFGFDWLVFQTVIGGSIDVTTRTPGLNFTTRFSL